MEPIICGNQNTTRLINAMKADPDKYRVLDKDEERALIKKFSGDRTALNRELVSHNVRIVFSQAKSYMSKTRDYDGLVQNGMIGLAEAAKRFDTGKGIKFCTYATIWVKKHMTMPFYTSQYKIDMNTVSLSTPTGFADADSQQGLTAEETIENSVVRAMDLSCNPAVKTTEDEVQSNEQAGICQALYSAMDADMQLSSTDKAVFRELFLEHDKTRDVADRHGLDMDGVNEIKRRILGKMRTTLASKYGINSFSEIG